MENDTQRARAVAAVAWPWKEREAASAQPESRRRSVFVNFAVGVTVGVCVLGIFHKTILGVIVLCVSAALLICGLTAPDANAAVQRFMGRFAAFVGEALTWLLLTPFFYICFTTGRLAQVLGGKDPLRRRFPAPEASTWHTVPPVRDADHYRRQY